MALGIGIGVGLRFSPVGERRGGRRFVVLTKADGTVFTTADGAVLIRYI